MLWEAGQLEQTLAEGTEQFLHIPHLPKALRERVVSIDELAQELANMLVSIANHVRQSDERHAG